MCIYTRVNDVTIQYKAEYYPFMPGLVQFQSRWGMSDKWYKRFKIMFEENPHMREYSHTTFFDLSNSAMH